MRLKSIFTIFQIYLYPMRYKAMIDIMLFLNLLNGYVLI